METRPIIRLHPKDNVAVAVRALAAGTPLPDGLTTLEDTPQAHKIALQDIPAGGPVVRYGVTLGYANRNIPAGGWVQESMLRLPEPPGLDGMPFGTNVNTDLPKALIRTFWGYRHPANPYAGTRNLLAIHTTVQCVSSVLKVAV
ncbi:MAG TPA: SAF domain-containing protein, partial [Clostridia bacterium]|nr:SAF domain-containing protein [Clostridia bacterium]